MNQKPNTWFSCGTRATPHIVKLCSNTSTNTPRWNTFVTFEEVGDAKKYQDIVIDMFSLIYIRNFGYSRDDYANWDR
jgi:hypothetical protein